MRMIRALLLLTVLSVPGSAFAANFLTIRERAGVSTVDYPIQLGRPFARGEISGAPQAIVNGVPVETQAAVKTRWPDGSVKHAILNFYIPTLTANGTVTVTFQNQSAPAGAGLTQAEMLGGTYNFDALMDLTNGTTQTASARTMLSNGSYTDWLRGPVATSIVLADHSTARQYDLGFDSYRAFRPIFHATFWPRIGKVRVRFIGEAANSEALEDQSYSLRLRLGSSSPGTAYSKGTFTHYAATRWTKEFWLGGAPSAIAIDHNLPYLASTLLIPNFDTRKTISESAIASEFNGWQSSAHDLYDAGNWDKAMPSTGGRPDIGPYPSWTVRWLFTGDERMQQQAFGNADLAAAWPMHFREADATKQLTRDGLHAGLGRVISITSRPTIYLSDLTYPYTSASDRVNIVGSRTTGGWDPDGAHQPDPFSPQYTLTGDFWYLEQLYFWAAWGAGRGHPGITEYYGRGPTGAEGGLQDQIRGQAWLLRNRCHAATLAPDGAPEKAYFTQLVDDAVAHWEGERNIQGTAFQGNAMWNWGQQMYAVNGASPIHHWSRGNSGLLDGNINPAVAKEAISTWEQSFMMYSLGRARELGYPTNALTAYLAVNIIGQLTSPDYSPFLISSYRMPTIRVSDSRFFDSWAGERSGYNASYLDPANPTNAEYDFYNNLARPEHGYSLIGLAATSMVADQPGGAAAWAFMEREALPTPYLNDNPKWAVLPRSVSGTPGDANAPAPVSDLRAR